VFNIGATFAAFQRKKRGKRWTPAVLRGRTAKINKKKMGKNPPIHLRHPAEGKKRFCCGLRRKGTGKVRYRTIGGKKKFPKDWMERGFSRTYSPSEKNTYAILFPTELRKRGKGGWVSGCKTEGHEEGQREKGQKKQ